MSKGFAYPHEPRTTPVLVAGVRTPWSKAGSELQSASAADLGVLCVRELIARAEIAPKEIDEVVFGCVGQQPNEANIARVIALRSGIPASVPAFTVQRNCASGFQAVDDAARRIAAGDGSLYIVGGTESMSSYPLLFGDRMTRLFERLMKARGVIQKATTWLGFRPSMLMPRVGLIEGLTDPTCGMIMGRTAEKLANEFRIAREEQDRFALESHRKAAQAQQDHAFAGEIFDAFLAPEGRAVAADNGPRADLSLESLAKLRPYFDRHEGSVTIGNSCPLTDGAAALVLMSLERARASGLTPLARLVSSAVAGLDPTRMGLGPAYAMPLALDAAGRRPDAVDIWEINEAFAAQVLACLRALESERFCRIELGRAEAFGPIDPARLNPRGGAIALGHPVGATGARLVLTLADQLHARGHGLGVATACIGGGQGTAQVWEAAA